MSTGAASTSQSAWGWRLCAGLGGAAIVAIYVAGLSAPLSNYDEPFYAEFMRAMARSGDFFTLTYQGGETLQRPPTAVALYALVAMWVPGELGMRLAPALCTALVALIAAAIVAARFRDRWAAAATAAFCAGIPSVLVYGRLVLSDPPFVLVSVLALAATLAAQERPRYLIAAGAALGAGFALKSFAAAIPLLALMPGWLGAAVRHRRARATIAAAAAVFVALAAPYFAVGLAVHGGRFWREHVGVMLFDRAAGELAPTIGIGGPLSYLYHLWAADGPLVALALLGGMAAAAGYAWRHRDRALGLVAANAAITLVLLSAIGTRLAHYLLLFYPAAAVCLGALAARLLADPGRARAGRPLLAALAATSLTLGLAHERFDAGAEPSIAAKDLAQVAADRVAARERVYTVDWYAPAFGYYVDRPWTLLVTVPAVATMVGGSDPFSQAGNVAAVPPWPAGSFVLAGPETDLGAWGIEVEHIMASSHGFVLARVRWRP
jgi:4-amino-4-deoxy-L-arabinose transferase-like glycosyltransferase